MIVLGINIKGPIRLYLLRDSSAEIMEKIMRKAGFSSFLISNELAEADTWPECHIILVTRVDTEDGGREKTITGTGKLSSVTPKLRVVNITNLANVQTPTDVGHSCFPTYSQSH